MKLTLIVAAGCALFAMAAHAGFPLSNTASLGDVGSAVVLTVTLADGSTLTAAPTR